MREGDGVRDGLVSGVFVTFTYAGFGCGRFMCVRHVFLWMFLWFALMFFLWPLKCLVIWFCSLLHFCYGQKKCL